MKRYVYISYQYHFLCTNLVVQLSVVFVETLFRMEIWLYRACATLVLGSGSSCGCAAHDTIAVNRAVLN